jgi:hypothetical protein
VNPSSAATARGNCSRWRNEEGWTHNLKHSMLHFHFPLQSIFCPRNRKLGARFCYIYSYMAYINTRRLWQLLHPLLRFCEAEGRIDIYITGHYFGFYIVYLIILVFILKHFTEQCRRVNSIRVSYSGDRRFKSRAQYQQSWLKVLVTFLVPPGQMLDSTSN